MGFLRKAFATTVLGLGLLFGSTFSQATTQLGFLLDASGSISAANYNLLRTGLNAALAGLPVDGSIEITIVSFGSGPHTVVSPTILTAGTLAAIQSAITAHAKDGGSTDTAGAITSLAGLMTGSAVFADPGTKSIINLATDGAPNNQSTAQAAAAAAFSAGIDALSIEAIGSGVSSPSALSNMALIAFPATVSILPLNSTTIPNPISGSFVVPVSDFDALAPVLLAKVQAAVVQVPEPGSLVLIAIALLGFAASRRGKRSSSQRQFA